MRKNLLFFIIFIIILLLVVLYFFYFNKNEIKKVKQTEDDTKEEIYNSNVIDGVNYQSKDSNGNEYIIDAEKGEIDISDSNIIFLTKVKALIKMSNSEKQLVIEDTKERKKEFLKNHV